MILRSLRILGFALMALVARGADAQSLSTVSIPDAATRGMAAIQQTQRISQKTQGCAGTCHLQMYGALAYRAALEHGLPVDAAAMRADALRWMGRRDLAYAVEQHATGEVAMTSAFPLLASHAVGVKPSMTTAMQARAVAMQQNPDGDWTAMSTRPPSNYSSFTFTALGLRALQLYAHPSQQQDVTARVARARAWLSSHQPQQTEDRTYQLLGLTWAGAPRTELAGKAAALLATQQADGGWTSLDGRASDAYATGQALVALHDAAGLALADAGWRRGIEFLLRTQASDGTWRVPTRLQPWISPPYYESGYPYGRDQFISVAGASWAVMALGRAVGQPTAPAPDTLPLASLAEPDVEPWVERAVFGTVSDLRKLLDEGLSPNATMTSGRVPLLSLVAPDVVKMRLLIDRGADVNARSQTRFTALMVAAQFQGAGDAIRLLLDHKAQVTAPEGSGTPLANAYPLFIATHGGNADVLAALHKAGDRLDAEALAIGNTPRTPLALAVTLNRGEVVQTLLDLGAPVDQRRPNGRTALAAAILNNRAPLVHLLLERGADVNLVDGTGMTPLMYAATTDFGDSTIVNLLLAAGARTDVRDSEGLTALERARRDRNGHVIAALEKVQR